jgi:hypothetical protein
LPGQAVSSTMGKKWRGRLDLTDSGGPARACPPGLR